MTRFAPLHRPLLAALLCWAGAEASAGDVEPARYVLPDRGYVERECADVETTLRWALDDSRRAAKIDVARARQFATEAAEVCAQRRRGDVSADDWLTQFGDTRKAFATTVFPCSSKEHCLQQSMTPTQAFPTNLASYSVFLFTDAKWLDEARAAEIEAIHDAFGRMGDSLGQHKGTIWLAKTGDSLQPDVERGKALADVFRLDYNDGPYVVTTSTRPDLADARTSVIVIRLEDIAPERVVTVLNVLEQDLRRGTDVNREALLVEEIWQRFRSIVASNSEISLSVKISFSAGKP